MWVKPDGTLLSFFCSEDDKYIAEIGVIFPSGSVSTTFPSPANAKEVYTGVAVFWSGTGTMWDWAKAGIRPVGGAYNYDDGRTSAICYDWVAFARASSRTVEWLSYSNLSTGTATVSVRGYRIER